MNLTQIYGDDPYQMTLDLLRRMDAAAKVPVGATIAITPDISVAKTASEGATTHPQIANAVIDYLRESARGERLFVAAGAGMGQDTMAAACVSGFQTLCGQKAVPFYDCKCDGLVTKTVAGLPLEISKRVLTADFLFNLPVLKGHRQMKVTCALGNAMGFLSESTRRGCRGLGFAAPIAAVNSLLPPQLVVVDGICGDLDFEGGGTPVHAGRIFATDDPVLADSFGAELLGYPAGELPYIALSQATGLGCGDRTELIVTRMGDSVPRQGGKAATRQLRALEQHLCQSTACPACYAAAIHALARLREQGDLGKLGEKVYIGQGYRGKRLDCAGLGACCQKFSCHLQGCPPTALEILRFLQTP